MLTAKKSNHQESQTADSGEILAEFRFQKSNENLNGHWSSRIKIQLVPPIELKL